MSQSDRALPPKAEVVSSNLVRLIGPAVGQDEAAVDADIAYAVERDWLVAAGNPAHSICLTDAGLGREPIKWTAIR